MPYKPTYGVPCLPKHLHYMFAVAVDGCTICLQLQLTVALYVCSCSWHLQLTFDTVADAFDICV